MKKHNSSGQIRFSIDRGGTFTDVYAEYGNEFAITKLLSEDPQNYPDAPIEGIRRILNKLGFPVTGGLDHNFIEWVRMGTTVATNALLEREGEKVALVTTAGFGDVLQIGYQNRPDIFDLQIKKPSLLYESVIEVDERIRPATPTEDKDECLIGQTGDHYKVVKEPDLQKIHCDLEKLLEQGITSVAIAFLHSYDCPHHEKQVGRIAQELGFMQISLSSEIMPMIKFVPRGDTTVVDGYLTPKIKSYLDGFNKGFDAPLPKNKLLFMQSDGGLSPAEHFRGSNAILSGPAGGVVGYAMTAFSKESKKPVIGFDMGGTSTDVSRYGGDFELVHETETAGVRLQAPQLNINTVAAGGGSRLFFENGMFKVGPQSAGAHPGPLCYRKNGYLTVTDANLVLGRLHPDHFPKIFGPDENMPLDMGAARAGFEKITKTINQAYRELGNSEMSIEEVASGFLEVANQAMARPIREISVMRGYNIREHILATFGGAGSQHACSIARMLGIKEIYIHRFSGILSAYGMGLADVVHETQKPASATLAKENLHTLTEGLDSLEKEAVKQLTIQGFPKSTISSKRYLNLRYKGTNNSYMIQESHQDTFESVFRAKHQREFGFDLPDRTILVDDTRVRATSSSTTNNRIKIAKSTKVDTIENTQCYFDNQWHRTPVYQLDTLGAGDSIHGPAMVTSDTSTVIVEPDCHLSITDYGDIKISVHSAKQQTKETNVDPILLSIFSNLFMSVAEQMGRSLQRTAISTNIKERLDFSCAIFDNKGNLVANAPHIPVHLGAMGSAVKEQIKRQKGNLNIGDVLVSNHPIAGGSHLPDITVITPVWKNNEIIFYTASRGHHADIGGMTPGSMPPFSKKLKDEGASIISLKLVKNGLFQEETIRDILQDARTIENNIADLKAQVSANQKGCEILMEMIDTYSLETVLSYMGHIQLCAENAVRDLLKKLASQQAEPTESLKAVDKMDDGTDIELNIRIDSETGNALFDFTGTGKEVSANWNTPKAVVYSSILYAIRSLLNTDLPLNQGCLAPITVKIPKGSILSPSPEAAVVGGNVLTSQRVVDVILKAFHAAAASQGCMNNLTFGNAEFGYYETIGGGAGAGPGWHGQSGVHTHMTNTRITDPEILEKRFPVMLRRFSLRKNSGGKGKFRGGDGLIREIEALDTIKVAILSERRVYPPYGMAGGQEGLTGENIYYDINNMPHNIGGKNEITLAPQERIAIKTPGGGGYGN